MAAASLATGVELKIASPAELAAMRVLQSGVEVPHDCGSPHTPPEWLDMARFRRGRKYFEDHIIQCIFGMHISLASGLCFPQLVIPMIYTGESSDPASSLRRYLHTYHHVAGWHFGDVWEEGSEAYKSIRTVRKMHSVIATKMNRDQGLRKFHQYLDPVTVDASSSSSSSSSAGPPAKRRFFSQFDMAMVQTAFCGTLTMKSDILGIARDQELEDYLHFWRGIGYLLGIEDRFNVCRETFQESLDFFHAVYKLALQPYLLSPPLPTQFFAMASAYLDGCNILLRFPLFSLKMFVYFVIVDGMKLVLPKSHRVQLGLRDRMRVWFLRVFLFVIRWCRPVRWMINTAVLHMSLRAQEIRFHNAIRHFAPGLAPDTANNYLKSQRHPDQLLNSELKLSPLYVGDDEVRCPFSVLASP